MRNTREIHWIALRLAMLLPMLTAIAAQAAPLPAAVPDPSGLPWLRTFSDDFTSPSGTLNGWTAMLGTGSQYGLTGWGNNEAQTYTADPSNLNISGGALNIVARVQSSGTNITSARITTQNLFSQAYGLFQFTARLPAGTDLWPAIWLLPATTSPNLASGAYGGWPTSGEIDIMESGLGHSLPPNHQVQGTFHSGPNPGQDQSQTAFYNTSKDPSFNTTNLNTYDLLWLPGADSHTPGTLKWYVNGNLYETRSGGWYNPPGASSATAPFDQPFYIVMNLAIGGPGTAYTGNLSPVDGTYTMQITDVEVFSFAQRGDLDQNGLVTAADVTAMMSALTDRSSFASMHAISSDQLNLLGDLTGDGKLTNADLQTLLNRLHAGTVPEPSSLALLAMGVCSGCLRTSRAHTLMLHLGIATSTASSTLREDRS